MTTMTGYEALERLVAACEQEFTSDATEADDEMREPDESEVAMPSSHITFGMIREARKVLASLRGWEDLIGTDPDLMVAPDDLITASIRQYGAGSEQQFLDRLDYQLSAVRSGMLVKFRELARERLERGN